MPDHGHGQKGFGDFLRVAIFDLGVQMRYEFEHKALKRLRKVEERSCEKSNVTIALDAPTVSLPTILEGIFNSTPEPDLRLRPLRRVLVGYERYSQRQMMLHKKVRRQKFKSQGNLPTLQPPISPHQFRPRLHRELVSRSGEHGVHSD